MEVAAVPECFALDEVDEDFEGDIRIWVAGLVFVYELDGASDCYLKLSFIYCEQMLSIFDKILQIHLEYSPKNRE